MSRTILGACALKSPVLATVLFTLLSALPFSSAVADDSEIAQRISAHMTALRVVQVVKAQTGYVGTMSISLDPSPRMRISTVLDGKMTDGIYVDDFLYTKSPDGSWQRRKVTGMRDGVDAMLRFGVGAIDVLADKMEDGTSTGRFLLAPPIPKEFPQDQVEKMFFICTFSKTTFLVDACSKQLPVPQTIKYVYSLPANIFDLPTEALSAPEIAPMVLPTP
jgi:hypothetical protein